MTAESLLKPYPKSFPEVLADYCRQIATAKTKNWHHDQRRALFMDFLRKGFSVEAREVELEHKVKVAAVRGYIDALFETTIFEFKTDLERERAAGLAEIKTYLLSRSGPEDYIAVLTDGETFETHQWNEGEVERIDSFRLQADDPLGAYLKIDQFRSSQKLRQPTSSDIVISFGPDSAAYRRASAQMRVLYDRVASEPAVATKFREWNKLLSKVYGAELGYADLFVTHTYLVVLSRLMVAQALCPKEKRNAEAYRGLMSGEYFVRKNLPNLAEPDFFSWALDSVAEPHFIGLIGRLETHVAKYKFGATSEDVLKELYQELVDPKDRHDLGEYYTPDWLADLTLDRLNYRGGTLLDPSCGSGTFLMAAVRRLRSGGLAKRHLVEAVANDLAGIDVHPLAVLMAKANLLLALGADVRGFVGEVRLPVFMADTLQTELDEGRGFLKIPAAAKRVFHIPLASIERPGDDLDAMIEEMQRFAEIAAQTESNLAAAKAGLMKKFDFAPDEAVLWRHNLEVATNLIREKKNSIWAFILRNAYRPVFIRRRKVQYVVGNPPWLSYRYIRNPEYKTRVRELAAELGLVARKSAHLLTQLDLSTVFYRHCERDFLDKSGKMGMVLPRSVIIGAKQHAAFQERGGFSKIIDCEEVRNLFNVPACVVLRLGKVVEGVSIPCEVVSGSVEKRNDSWDVAQKSLSVRKATHEFVTHEIRSPWYRSQTLQGATLVPRSLYFVEIDPNAAENLCLPFLRSSRKALEDAKSQWKNPKVQVSGQLERDYLFYTVLADGLLPFAVRSAEPVFLPIMIGRQGQVEMVASSEMLTQGDRLASKWMAFAARTWETYRKDPRMDALGRLNYNRFLSCQNVAQKHVVIYNSSGTNLTSACIDTSPGQVVNGIPVNGFIADAKTYYLYLDSRDHADYLCAVLNSAIVMEAIKATMPRGLMGERDIHRRPFEVCEIPRFDSAVGLHREIANLGATCRKKAAKVAPEMTGRLGRVRQDMRLYLHVEIAEIDRLVAQLLKRPAARGKKPPLISPGQLPLF